MNYSENLNILLKESLDSFSQISEASWTYKIKSSKWSKKEILGHLCDSAIFNLSRFESALTKAQIDVFPYPQEALVNANNYNNRETNSLIEQWKNLNEHIESTWKNYEPKDFEKTAILHTTKEKVNLQFWLTVIWFIFSII